MSEAPQTREGRPELIFAFVGAAGSRLADLSNELKAALGAFGYDAIDIRLSALLSNFTNWTPVPNGGPSEARRITHLQQMGNALRDELKDGAAVVRAGITEIRQKRMAVTGSPDRPAWSHAFIVHQLKNPAEVDLLREVYGSSFILIAGHAPRQLRVGELARRIAHIEAQRDQVDKFRSHAEIIIEADEKQEGQFGQNTRDTYPRADFFTNLVGEIAAEVRSEVRRFVELLFGHPFHTPKPEEFAMYQASATALRSSDDNRQVGAVVAKVTYDAGKNIRDAEVISSGMNEVPRAGGGYYWQHDSPDLRDQKLLERDDDRATEIKVGALAELLGRMRQKDWLTESVALTKENELARTLLPELKGTQFMNIGEFGRPVHAEMAALIDAARRGVSVNGHSLYVTTFPCHNCAKHIIAAGIRRVVYLEPYPKSRVGDLHREEIDLESTSGMVSEGDNRVVFWAFSGIAPRQYRDLFNMAERGAQKGNSLKRWLVSLRQLSPVHVMQNASHTYLTNEREALVKLSQSAYRWDQKRLCPDEATNETGDKKQ